MMSYQEGDERPSERVMREMAEQREREEAERERQEAERQLERSKMTAISEMKSALDRYSRVMRWKTDTYMRPMDFSEGKYEEELEIAAWQIQGMGETLRELLPEFFWPKGTPVTGKGGVYMRPERLQALKLDLEATAESINDALTDLVEEDEDEDD
jgi:hypothetical protein